MGASASGHRLTLSAAGHKARRADRGGESSARRTECPSSLCKTENRSRGARISHGGNEVWSGKESIPERYSRVYTALGGGGRLARCGLHARTRLLARGLRGRGRTAAAGTKERERESAYGLRGAHTFYFYFARWITREEQDSEPGEFLVPTDR